MLHIILMISLSPSQAAIQAFCVAQHCSSGRRKETWARLLQARTEWWKTVMWQCCISSVWNDSKFLLSLGTHRGLGKTTTPTWQLLNISWRPLDVAKFMGMSLNPKGVTCPFKVARAESPSICPVRGVCLKAPWNPLSSGLCIRATVKNEVLNLFCYFKAKFCNILNLLHCTNVYWDKWTN